MVRNVYSLKRYDNASPCVRRFVGMNFENWNSRVHIFLQKIVYCHLNIYITGSKLQDPTENVKFHNCGIEEPYQKFYTNSIRLCSFLCSIQLISNTSRPKSVLYKHYKSHDDNGSSKLNAKHKEYPRWTANVGVLTNVIHLNIRFYLDPIIYFFY